MFRLKKNLNSRAQGFTLVELLVVSGLLGIVAVAIFAAISSGLNVYSRIKLYEQKKADILFAIEKLEADLKNTFIISGFRLSGSSEVISFPGLVKAVDSAGNSYLSLGKIYYYRNKESGNLLRAEQAYAQALSGSVSSLKEAPLVYIEAINFSYCIYNSETKTYSWNDVWDLDNLPKSVKIKVYFNNKGINEEFTRTVVLPMAG